MLVVGIDPDTIKSGVAISRNGKLHDLCNLEFVELCHYLAQLPPSTIVGIEDVGVDKAVYNRPGENRAKMLKIAQNVGMVKATAIHIEAVARSFNLKVKMIPPLAKSSEHARRAKKDAAYFNQLTGWAGRTNEEQRDAGMIAFFLSK